MKGVRFLTALLALVLAGCGDGSIKSPDFTPQLATLTIAPTASSIALGRTQQFTATGTCTTPENTTAPCAAGARPAITSRAAESPKLGTGRAQ